MATLKKRRGMWYARKQWKDENGTRKEKQIPLRTKSKVTAIQRLFEIKKVESDMVDGLSFSFPWLNDEGLTKIKIFQLEEAVNEWMSHRKKNKIREKTLEINQLGLKYLLECCGSKRSLASIGNSDILNFIDFLDYKGNSDTSINIHLRTVKAMLRHFNRMGKLDKVPVIEQRKIAKTDPVYITDQAFHEIMGLGILDAFYKRVFLLYRETGMRLREPFISSLNGSWIDIPPESKSHAVRSIELNTILIQIFTELKAWHETGYGSVLSDPGEHLSKIFKKCLRNIGASEKKHFHSLRHTFAVRKLIMGTSIYDVKLMMGHASVTTTEQYSKMNLKRVAQDFPTLVSTYAIEPKMGKEDTLLEDTAHIIEGYVPLYDKIES